MGDGGTAARVLEDWTPRLERDYDAGHLFDLASGATIYWAFLFPGALQVTCRPRRRRYSGRTDPSSNCCSAAPSNTPPKLPSASHLFGLCVHHAVSARFCVERGRLWQGHHWISKMGENGLTLAYRRLGLKVHQGRGYDELPAEVLQPFEDTLVRSLDRAELLRALRGEIDGLLREADEARELASQVEGQLRELVSPDIM